MTTTTTEPRFWSGAIARSSFYVLGAIMLIWVAVFTYTRTPFSLERTLVFTFVSIMPLVMTLKLHRLAQNETIRGLAYSILVLWYGTLLLLVGLPR